MTFFKKHFFFVAAVFKLGFLLRVSRNLKSLFKKKRLKSKAYFKVGLIDCNKKNGDYIKWFFEKIDCASIFFMCFNLMAE